MAKYLKSNPVGIDKQLNRLQEHLYDGLGYADFNSYGRAYLLKNSENQIVPHRYLEGSEGDYEEILYDDTLNGLSFILDSDETSPFSGVYMQTQISIVMMFDLEKLKPSVVHVADEEIRNEVISVLERFRYFTITNIVKNEEALSDFETDLEAIHPRFFLKITGNIKYQFNC